MKKFILLTLFSFSAFLSSEDVVQSLRWQKVQLEDKLQKKIANSLKTVVDPKDFVVSVELELKEVKPLKFKNKISGKKDKQEDEIVDVKLSNIKFDESKGDYIAFSKVGLEVPVLSKLFQKEKKSQAETFNPIELEQKKWEYQDYVRRMRDLFLHIKDIKINIFVNEKLPKQIKDTISNLLKSLEINIAGIEPLYNIKQIKMDVEVPKPEPKLFEGYTPNDYVDLAVKFSTLIGTLMAAFLIGIFLFICTRTFIKYKEREKAKLNLSGNLQNDSNSKEESKKEEDEGGSGGLSQSPLSPDEVQAGQLGLERFVTYMEKNATESQILIKKWIQMANDEQKYQHILTAIGQQVGFDQFQSLLAQLSEEERYRWGQMVGALLKPEQLVRANAILNEELIGQIIVPSEIKSSELIDILLNIEKKDALRLIGDNEEMGALYLRMVNPNVASGVFAKVEQNKIGPLIDKAMNMNMQEVAQDIPKIISFFKEYQSSGKVLPFANKVYEMFKDITPAREIELFKGLAKSGQMGTLKKAIDAFFPASLLLKLPANILTVILKDYPLNTKIDLIASLDEEEKNNLMEIIAPEGSTLKELITIEFENLENDENRMRKIFKERDKIFGEFTKYARGKIKSNKEFESDLEKVKSKFIKELGGESGSGNDDGEGDKTTPNLSLAS